MPVRRLLGWLLGQLVRVWIATLRFEVRVDSSLEDATAKQKPWVLAFWHGQQFGLLRWPRRTTTVALVSLSRDGELQTGALSACGLAVERGSSSRGGARGLMAVVRRLRRGQDAAFAMDGPKGPHRRVRSGQSGVGALLAASRANALLVPMASACSRAKVMARAWDRFELPLPFTRVAVVLGPPLLPNDASAGDVARAIDAARMWAELDITRPHPPAPSELHLRGHSAPQPPALSRPHPPAPSPSLRSREGETEAVVG